MKKEISTGATPHDQGYWNRIHNNPRTPPDWHPVHKEKWWIDEWFRGWDKADGRSNEDNV